ncbi:MAG: hypothetical protein L3J59_12890 [Methylococcaceae bacterium]|nr:hypothetical protein [Methylococcaceae bacterium]
MEQKRDELEVLFDDKARSILFDLVDRTNPSQPTSSSEDDTFEPTISAVFSLFHDLMVKNTPDLYQAEWLRIIRAIENTRLQKHRLPVNTDAARSKLIMSLEDTDSLDGEINNFELSKKLAGFSLVEICSILYHSQKYYVAKRHNEKYLFPKIELKV